MKKLAMLLCVATIAAGVISCENKAKKETEETSKQEFIQEQQETVQKVISEEEEHNEILNSQSDFMYSKGRGDGYRNGVDYEPYEEERWYKINLKLWKSVWIQNNMTSEDMKVLEEAYKKGYHEGFTMAQSEK